VAVEPMEGEIVTGSISPWNPKSTIENYIMIKLRNYYKLTNVGVEGLINSGISSTG
jgi:hypothetical protein